MASVVATNLSKCTCGKSILWGEMKGGKRIPLDPQPPVYRLVQRTSNGALVEREYEAFVSHFVNCPDAQRHSGSNRR